jgi:hypothetical protein
VKELNDFTQHTPTKHPKHQPQPANKNMPIDITNDLKSAAVRALIRAQEQTTQAWNGLKIIKDMQPLKDHAQIEATLVAITFALDELAKAQTYAGRI